MNNSPMHTTGVAMPPTQATQVMDDTPYGIFSNELPPGVDLESGTIEMRSSTMSQQPGEEMPDIRTAVQYYRALFAEQAPEWCSQCCDCCPSAGGVGGNGSAWWSPAGLWFVFVRVAMVFSAIF